MDEAITDLYDPIMEWFSGLDYPWCNTFPGCAVHVRGPFDEYAVNYAHSGRVWHSVAGGKARVLEAPVAWWIPSGMPYEFGPVDGKPWDHHYICFKGPRVRRWIREGLAPDRPPFHRTITRPDEFQAAMLRVIRLWRESLGRSTPELVHATEGVLLLLQRQEGVRGGVIEDEGPRQRLTRLVETLRADPRRGIACAAAAAQVGWSEPHFRRLFREITGFAPVDYVIRNRLMHAAGMLERTDLPLKEVALRCGFPDIYYFTRQFCRLHGVPPGRFRAAKTRKRQNESSA